jgi:flagellar hook-associated protein 3 FlgL
MSTRIGDLGQSLRLTGFLLQTQSRVREAQAAVASGVRARDWDEIGDRTTFLVAAREQRLLTERFASENEKVLGRLEATEASLASVSELAERLRTLLVARLGEPGESAIPLDAEAEHMAKELAGLLNRRLGDRYLFAGSRVDTPPVALPDPLPTTADPSLYYRGDGLEPTVRADPEIELAYGTTAAAEPFARLFAALGKAREAHRANDRAGLEQALADAAAAVRGVADERGRLGFVAERLESIVDGQRGALVYLDERIGAIVDTDMAATVSRLARDQAALEATYLVVARLNQTSLADYLR